MSFLRRTRAGDAKAAAQCAVPGCGVHGAPLMAGRVPLRDLEDRVSALISARAGATEEHHRREGGRTMSWVDEAERLGRLVDAGEITKAEAVEQLLSTGISLSPDGAADLIGRWRTIRADLAASRREMAPDRKWAQRS